MIYAGPGAYFTRSYPDPDRSTKYLANLCLHNGNATGLFKHFKDFLRKDVCNQMRMDHLKESVHNLKRFSCQKSQIRNRIRPGQYVLDPIGSGSTTLLLHWGLLSIFFACTYIFCSVLTQLVRQGFSPERNEEMILEVGSGAGSCFVSSVPTIQERTTKTDLPPPCTPCVLSSDFLNTEQKAQLGAEVLSTAPSVQRGLTRDLLFCLLEAYLWWWPINER